MPMSGSPVVMIVVTSQQVAGEFMQVAGEFTQVAGKFMQVVMIVVTSQQAVVVID